MLERDLILEEAHVVVISLETMAENKEMHANEVVWGRRLYIVVGLEYFLLAQLLAILHHFNELLILVLLDGITLFEDDGTHFSELLEQTTFLYFKFRLFRRVNE